MSPISRASEPSGLIARSAIASYRGVLSAQYKTPSRNTNATDVKMICLRRRRTRIRSERVISSDLPRSPASPAPRMIPRLRCPDSLRVELIAGLPLVRLAMWLVQLKSVDGINGGLDGALQPHGSVVPDIAQGNEHDIFCMQLQVLGFAMVDFVQRNSGLRCAGKRLPENQRTLQRCQLGGAPCQCRRFQHRDRGVVLHEKGARLVDLSQHIDHPGFGHDDRVARINWYIGVLRRIFAGTYVYQCDHFGVIALPGMHDSDGAACFQRETAGSGDHIV